MNLREGDNLDHFIQRFFENFETKINKTKIENETMIDHIRQIENEIADDKKARNKKIEDYLDFLDNNNTNIFINSLDNLKILEKRYSKNATLALENSKFGIICWRRKYASRSLENINSVKIIGSITKFIFIEMKPLYDNQILKKKSVENEEENETYYVKLELEPNLKYTYTFFINNSIECYDLCGAVETNELGKTYNYLIKTSDEITSQKTSTDNIKYYKAILHKSIVKNENQSVNLKNLDFGKLPIFLFKKTIPF